MQLSDALVVQAFHRNASAGGARLAAEASGWLRVGDRLVAVNGAAAEGRPLAAVVAMVAAASVPKRLTFAAGGGGNRSAEMALALGGPRGAHGHAGLLELARGGVPLGSVPFLQAMFGGALASCRAAPLVRAQPAHGCGAYANAEQAFDAVVLVERGVCAFSDKALLAQQASARAVVVMNDAAQGAGAVRMPIDPDEKRRNGGSIAVPAVMIDAADALTIKALVEAAARSRGVVLARLVRQGQRCRPWPRAAGAGGAGSAGARGGKGGAARHAGAAGARAGEEGGDEEDADGEGEGEGAAGADGDAGEAGLGEPAAASGELLLFTPEAMRELAAADAAAERAAAAAAAAARRGGASSSTTSSDANGNGKGKGKGKAAPPPAGRAPAEGFYADAGDGAGLVRGSDGLLHPVAAAAGAGAGAGGGGGGLGADGLPLEARARALTGGSRAKVLMEQHKARSRGAAAEAESEAESEGEGEGEGGGEAAGVAADGEASPPGAAGGGGANDADAGFDAGGGGGGGAPLSAAAEARAARAALAASLRGRAALRFEYLSSRARRPAPRARLRVALAEPPQACEPLGAAAAAAARGAALVVERGGCAFADKARAAAAAGAALLVVANDNAGLFAMTTAAVAGGAAGGAGGAGGADADAADRAGELLPAVMITKLAGRALRAAVAEWRAAQRRMPAPAPPPLGGAASLEAASSFGLALVGDGAFAAAWEELTALTDSAQWPQAAAQRRKLYLRLSRVHHPDKPSGSADRFELLSYLYRRANAKLDPGSEPDFVDDYTAGHNGN